MRSAVRLIADSAAAPEHIEGLERQFERLLARSERQRNMTIHGHLPPHSFVETASTFLGNAGSYAARDLFRHDMGQEAEGLVLARERTAFERAKLALADGDGHILTTLFIVGRHQNRPEHSSPASPDHRRDQENARR